VNETEMRDALNAAVQKLGEQNTLLMRLTQGPLFYGTVVSLGTETRTPQRDKGAPVRMNDGRTGKIFKHDELFGETLIKFGDDGNEWHKSTDYVLVDADYDYVVVVVDGKLVEVEAPPGLPLAIGDTVKVVTETMQIVSVASMTHLGEVVIVTRVVNGYEVEVAINGATHLVSTGQCNPTEQGDRVVLDAAQRVVLRNLGKADDQYLFMGTTNVSWTDIGGLTEAKRALIEAIEQPYRHPELYAFYGQKPTKGILLYGPPGCGKTMLGKAAATSIAQMHGHDRSHGFFYVKGPELLNKYVGETEARIRQLFQQARDHEKRYGYPAVIFIDEADAIMAKRGSGISSDVEKTIVPMFLTEMDGLEASNTLVILSTNRPDILDPAIDRDGRIDEKIKVTRPTQATAAEIFALNLHGVPLNNGYTVPDLATFAASTLFATDKVLYQVGLRNGTSLNMTFAELANGAMIAGVVNKARAIAMRRDIAAGKPEGIRKDDLIEAVEAVFRQNRDLDHQDEIANFVDAFGADVTTIQRAVSAAA